MSHYHHTQRAPTCLLIYAASAAFLVSAWAMRGLPAGAIGFLIGSILLAVLAAAFHHLTVSDESDRLAVRFGPVPLFHRSVPYDLIVSAEQGRTTLLDGWGIHYSLQGGWVWNLWGFDCVVLQLQKGKLLIGTDDAENLCRFVQERIADRK
ncbi:MAG: hypothetical protein DWQ34_14955 [Planctomycetota bacterium]|nr:MAG: hypothetical protein DWQ29_13895 [Planctomycetota bacterium]REJ91456.1 MAG: hypothetical protein DWQ34_14955 [Planctomycetota bacterium]REK25580.1 MAG: hypothetical protein DWQ41_11615 [Planctomycetota bacterium]REK31708.1 MAG: hypothetical protein DWQ45_19070 [Planctomycetota bacterium]